MKLLSFIKFLNPFKKSNTKKRLKSIEETIENTDKKIDGLSSKIDEILENNKCKLSCNAN